MKQNEFDRYLKNLVQEAKRLNTVEGVFEKAGFQGVMMGKKSEKYGFVVPLRPDLHPNGVNFKRTPENLKIDLFLKQEAQLHYEENIGSREDFRREFGKSWL